MKKILAVVLAGSFISTPAFAETFSGPYIGVQAGLDNYDLDADVFGEDVNGTGIQGGVYAGYDYSFSKTFFGLEASADLSDADATFGEGAGKLRIAAKETFGVSTRFGAMLSDNTALYGRVGWANTKFKASFGGESVSDHNNALTLGAGVETRVGAGSLRVEYVRADYADELKNNRVAVGYGFRF